MLDTKASKHRIELKWLGRSSESFNAYTGTSRRKIGMCVLGSVLLLTLFKIYHFFVGGIIICRRPISFELQAQKILKKNPLIDGHDDLLIFIRGRYKNRIYDPDFKDRFEKGGLPQHVDLPRLDSGKQGGAFWSAFVPCPPGNGTDFSTERYAPRMYIQI